MGLCSSTEDGMVIGSRATEDERRINKSIDHHLLEQKKVDCACFKLLLLGAGESGKSTLFKQCIQAYGKGFSDRDRCNYGPVISSNIIESMKVLIKHSHLITGCRYSGYPATETAVAFIQRTPDNAIINREFAGYCKAAWADAGIKKTYSLRSNFQLPDECAWFFDHLDRIASESYVPSYDDILRVRARTTGINETEFQVNDTKFKLIDVGGQRSERRKWLHCFDHVTSCIFVAAISEYDQVLAEDGHTNRLVEALDLFEDVCNSPWLCNTSMILFLNKRDLFRQKISPQAVTPPPMSSSMPPRPSHSPHAPHSPYSYTTTTASSSSSSSHSSSSNPIPSSLALNSPVPLNQYFTDYTGGADYERAAEFIKFKFLARNKHPEKKEVFVHITCATDTQQIRFTLDAVTLIVRENALRSSGLI